MPRSRSDTDINNFSLGRLSEESEDEDEVDSPHDAQGLIAIGGRMETNAPSAAEGITKAEKSATIG